MNEMEITVKNKLTFNQLFYSIIIHIILVTSVTQNYVLAQQNCKYLIIIFS